MPQPTDIKLRTQSRLLEVHFDDGSRFELPFEYLRVFSPSAEVTGHGGGGGVLQTGEEAGAARGAAPRTPLGPPAQTPAATIFLFGEIVKKSDGYAVGSGGPPTAASREGAP